MAGALIHAQGVSHTGVKWQRTASQTHWPGHLKLQHWENVKWPKNRGSSDTWEAMELHVGEGQHGMGLSVKKGKRNREMSRETHPGGEKDCREWRDLEFISWGTWWICVCRDGWGSLVFLYWYPLSVDAFLSYQSKAKQNKTATKEKKKMAGLWWTPQLILAHTGKPNSQIWTLSPFQQCFFFFLFFFFTLFIFLKFVVDFVIHWNETAMGLHVFPILIPPPTSLSTRSL